MVEDLLAKVGKSTFAEYFLLFKFDRKVSFDLFCRGTSKQFCCDERWHFARMIFDRRLEKEALTIISNTKTINPQIIQISKNYLKAL